jgi:hypothetical protein
MLNNGQKVFKSHPFHILPIVSLLNNIINCRIEEICHLQKHRHVIAHYLYNTHVLFPPLHTRTNMYYFHHYTLGQIYFAAWMNDALNAK